MAGRLPLRTKDLPGLSPLSEEASVASPARGRETRTALLAKLRPPPLVHAWDFWHEKPSSSSAAVALPTSAPAGNSATDAYKPQLSVLAPVTDVRTFWSLFNNFDFGVLPMGAAVHLFHKSVKPIWEDDRNLRGGCWTFRVPKANAAAFWQEISLLAIGEQLQEAVRDETVHKFRDDICGISFAPRRTAVTFISIWNRDGDNKKGIHAILDTVMNNIPEELKPADGTYYYKKHSDHASFTGSAPVAASSSPANVASAPVPRVSAPPKSNESIKSAHTPESTSPETPIDQVEARKKTEEEEQQEDTSKKSATSMSEMAEKMDAMEKEVMKLRKILEEVRLRDEALLRNASAGGSNEANNIDSVLK